MTTFYISPLQALLLFASTGSGAATVASLLGSCGMYMIGLGMAVIAGTSDIAGILSAAGATPTMRASKRDVMADADSPADCASSVTRT